MRSSKKKKKREKKGETIVHEYSWKGEYLSLDKWLIPDPFIRDHSILETDVFRLVKFIEMSYSIFRSAHHNNPFARGAEKSFVQMHEHGVHAYTL